jgi:hypothetical protein
MTQTRQYEIRPGTQHNDRDVALLVASGLRTNSGGFDPTDTDRNATVIACFGKLTHKSDTGSLVIFPASGEADTLLI